MPQTKTCPVCNNEKPLSDFSVKTKVRGGKKYPASECNICAAKRSRDRYRVRNYHAKLREQCFDILGHSCARCGFSDKRALQFDHINGNGAEERKVYKGLGVYRRIVAVGGIGYQVLCANCNTIKKIENDETARKYKDNT